MILRGCNNLREIELLFFSLSIVYSYDSAAINRSEDDGCDYEGRNVGGYPQNFMVSQTTRPIF
jgi:hypothetical protein